MSCRLLVTASLACALAACPTTTTSDGGTQGSGSNGTSSGGTRGTSSGGNPTGGSSSSGTSGGNGSASSGTSGGNGSSGGGASLTLCTNGAGASPTCAVTIDDGANCGACGNACGQGQVCSLGHCLAQLPSEGCSYSLYLDGGVYCTATGTQLCPPLSDAGYGNGCPCPNLQTDPSNCGACGNACGTGQLCTAGSCGPACAAGQVEDLTVLSSQGLTCLPAAEVVAQNTEGPLTITNTLCPATATASAYLATLELDPNNCGSCGHLCPASCIGGICSVQCGSGTYNCDYPTPQGIDGGVCPTGQTLCGSGNGGCPCADLQTDPGNCGACGNACPSGACQGGQCASGCPTGQLCATLGSGSSFGLCAASCPTFFGLQMTSCGTVSAPYCTVTAADDANCGSCGTVCPAGQKCADGTCLPSCNQDTQACDGGCANGQSCVGGSCVAACPAGQICSALYDACVSSCG